jgi:hypothetical protein
MAANLSAGPAPTAEPHAKRITPIAVHGIYVTATSTSRCDLAEEVPGCRGTAHTLGSDLWRSLPGRTFNPRSVA